jgi:hypothetical protein
MPDTYAQRTYAQPTYAQPTYAQPAYAQPAYAQPAYAQPAYAQPTYAQPAYAQRTSKLTSPQIVIVDTNVLCCANDWRCCGLYYLCCSDNNYDCCPVSLITYWYSGYIQTTAGYTSPRDDNWCCTCFCLPVKLPLTFICCLGSAVNQWLNCCCNTKNMNYLFWMRRT